MKIIDIENWKGKKHYLWFKNYPVPYYSVTSRLDLTRFLGYIKERKYPFFISFMYILNLALNEIEEFRLREVNGQVVLYDVIHPAYTIMTNDMVFDNCEHEFCFDYSEYKSRAEEKIPLAKQGLKEDQSYTDLTRFDQFYFTCLPWLDFTAVTHPMPNDATLTVPRIAWGKYVEENGKTTMALNIHVSHALVDGYPLAQGFNKVQEYLDQAERFIK